jgi:RimJ/RimL family protein N-acetyltransferase
LITIRRIQSGETQVYKRIRLMALQEAPYAFPTTLAAARKRGIADWREQAESAVHGNKRAIFFALNQKQPVGIAALCHVDEEPGLGELLQVWISPEQRGTSLAKDLMDAVLYWAKENGFTRVKAGVTAKNIRARTFYLHYGFSVLEELDEGTYLVFEV